MSQFVETLKDVLIEKNMTIKDLSKYLTIPERTLYDIKNYNPTIKTALKIVYYFSSWVLPNNDNLITICNYLDCSIDEILGRKYSFKFEVS